MVKNDFHKRDKRTDEQSYPVAVHAHGTTVRDTATAPPYVMTIPDQHCTRIFPGSCACRVQRSKMTSRNGSVTNRCSQATALRADSTVPWHLLSRSNPHRMPSSLQRSSDK